MSKLEELVKKWKESGAWIGLTAAPALWFLLVIVVGTAFYSCEAKAKGWWFPESPELSFYVEIPKDSPFCDGGGQEITSNISARQIIWKNGASRIGIQVTHHSCGFIKDINPYDAIGIGVSWKP